MSSFNILKNYKREKYHFLQSLWIVVISIVILFSILIVRLFYLQIWQHKFYSTLSTQNHLALLPIEPNRGLIYDRNGILLAENVPIYSLDVLPENLKKFEKDLPKLQSILEISDDQLDQFYKTYNRQRIQSTPLKLNMTEEEVAKFYLDQYQFPELTIKTRMVRHYPEGENTVSVLGYMGRINAQELKTLDLSDYSASNFIGKIGVEKFYEKQLHGIVGYQQAEINASSRIERTLSRSLPTPGNNLYLTIDSKLQAVAKAAFQNERGAAIVIVPKTGEILALVSNPGYDPNLFATGISAKIYKEFLDSPDKPLYNRAVRGAFPPGSTIKPFMALEGLDSGTIDINFKIQDPGWFKLPKSKHIYRDWVKLEHGEVNVVNAIIVSCDTFFYTLASMLGINKIDYILDEFGFGRKTGIDLNEELVGHVPSPAWKLKKTGISWYPGDTIVAGIGQGYMISTPLQLAYAVSTIANRGIRFKPHLLLKMQDSKGGETYFKPIVDKPVVLKDNSNWDLVIQGMQGVIESVKPWGTGRIRFGSDVKYPVAAKTGTVQLYRHARNDENEAWEAKNVQKNLRNHSVFIAFSPIDDPKIAVAVIVENSMIAGSVARKILDYYYADKQLK